MTQNAAPGDFSSATVTGLDGIAITNAQLLDRIETLGLALITREPAERLSQASWTVELESLATARGLGVTIADMGRVVLVHDGDLPASSFEDVVRSAREQSAIERPAASRLESRNNHPSQPPRLRLIPGGAAD